MNRTDEYDQMVSKKLRNHVFAQSFVLGLIEGDDGFSVVDALKHTISRMGVTEFAKLARLPRPNVMEFIKGKRKLKPETIDQYLKPFRLKSKLTVEKAS